MATLKDVAKAAGLSVTQVSRALNGHSDVNPDTRERVKAVARTLRYQPNLSARKLVSGRSGMVGLVVPQAPDLASDGLFMEVVAGLSTQFSARGMQFVLHVARQDEPILPVYQRLIGHGALDGFVLTDPQEDDPRAALLAGEGIPFVVHGRIGSEPRHAYFDIDNECIFFDLAGHLIGLGHRRIALLNGVPGRTYVTARRTGFLRAMAGAGLDPDGAIIRNGEMTEALGLVSVVDLFAPGAAAPTAIICGNTRVAKGVYHAANALGLAIPGDVSVIAHDDHLATLKSAAFFPALSVSDAPLRDSWQPLAGCLAASLDGAPLKQAQIVGPHRMILRDSTAAPRV
ncbi:substrate-binding domain-containing protein [Paracoccus spongiarum]|uniref:Substrate-binding domain-containing protein n=1 Tax=Paracoccus spongiarum TaxID=3064387 RepID=A0ABT9JC59_9RHOB|nr:substrate-binding domain-containing protein [Paracoccus sp. 2205BS29-5]MDP5307391.1 substrate-binding domain-containing protein [Paracoccus sp. 2205BS29-5]